MSEKARAFAESDEEEEGKEGDQKLSKGKLRKANRLSVARMFMVLCGWELSICRYNYTHLNMR